jgi:glycosyltransferase involved in cell wall biosynthesis
LVSVVIPVYNGTDYIRLSLDSVRAQTYSNLEIIVVDDGSSDGDRLEEIVAAYAPVARLYRQPNGGVASALNHGLREMRGELFSWLSHDDLYHPRKLELEVAEYVSGSEPAVIFSNYCYIDATGRVLDFQIIPYPPGMTARSLLLHYTWVHGCATMIPRDAIHRVGAFDERLRTTQDYDLFFRLAGVLPFRHVNRIHAAVRRHGRQNTQTQSATVFAEQDEMYASWVRTFTASNDDGDPQSDAAFYRRLYRRFIIGLLPGAAAAARAAADSRRKTVFDVFSALVTTLTLNAWTAGAIRRLVMWKQLFLAARRTSRLDMTWEGYIGSGASNIPGGGSA